VQAARGGSNPAIRTLFYRLVRLMGHSIQPLFVFDGPNKPAFKRGKRSAGQGDATSKAMMKRLIRLFGFAAHDAPGEAEAECALLQQKGVVDAVLSEDVDTIMFGCGKTMRSWSAESKGSATPTHVTVYDADALRKGEKGLDREGMVLVALMSGGDYLPEGIPGCGVKVACEAARAGFGSSLCRIKRSDQLALDEWKADFLHQLRTNEKGYFRTKHKALAIPDNFPNMDVLRYYTHPVVSQQATVERLGQDFPSKTAVDIAGLREFVRETFDWTYRVGAVKLVRVLAPSLLVQSLLDASTDEVTASQDRDAEKRKESVVVKAISNRRTHFSTDAMPELRISYVPIDMVPLDLASEPEEIVASYGRDGLALNSDDEFDEEIADAGDEAQSKKGKTKAFDPLQPNLVWVPETIVQYGAPLTFEDWEESRRLKEVAKEAAAAAPRRGRQRGPKKAEMPSGSLDKWVKVTKNAPNLVGKDPERRTLQPRSPLSSPGKFALPPQLQLSSSPAKDTGTFQAAIPSSTRSKPARKPRGKAAPSKQTSSSSSAPTNPWTQASSQVSPRVTKTAAGSGHPPKSAPPSRKGMPSFSGLQQEPILISSSPAAPAPTAGSPSGMKRTQQAVRDHDPPSSDPFTDLLSSSPAARQQSPRARRKPSQEAPSSPATRTTRARRTNKAARDIRPGLKQASIKSYGTVSHATPSSSSNIISKVPDVVVDSDPLRSLSEDDEGDVSLPPLSSFGRSKSGAGTGVPPAENRDDAPQPPSSQQATASTDFPAIDDIFGEGAGSTAQAGKSTKKRLYIPRKSAVGYFREVEVEPEEAERLGRIRGVVRYSDVSVVDLTGED
jgi:Holliday junction resolvase YEN1